MGIVNLILSPRYDRFFSFVLTHARLVCCDSSIVCTILAQRVIPISSKRMDAVIRVTNLFWCFGNWIWRPKTHQFIIYFLFLFTPTHGPTRKRLRYNEWQWVWWVFQHKHTANALRGQHWRLCNDEESFVFYNRAGLSSHCHKRLSAEPQFSIFPVFYFASGTDIHFGIVLPPNATLQLDGTYSALCHWSVPCNGCLQLKITSTGPDTISENQCQLIPCCTCPRVHESNLSRKAEDVDDAANRHVCHT